MPLVGWRRRWRSALATLAVVVSAITACSQNPSANEGSEPQERLSRLTPSPQDPDPTSLKGIPDSLRIAPGPLDAFVVSDRNRAVLDYAQEVLIAQCMQGRGFSYSVPRFEEVLAYTRGDSELADSRIFGIVDEGDAERFGFGDPPLPPDTRDNTFSPEEREALIGDLLKSSRSGTISAPREMTDGPASTGPGCVSVGREQLIGAGQSQALTEPLAESLKVESYIRAAAKPAFFAVQKQWSECMRDKGYKIENPAKPGLSRAFKTAITSRAPGVAAPKAEVQLAKADIQCKKKVDLVQRLMALVNTESASLAELNALVLDEEKNTIAEVIKKATRLLEGREPGE